MSKYDPQPADVWSLAIIFCCMTLRRFPWKAPRITDNSYKLFVAPPNDGPKSITQTASPTTNSPQHRTANSEPPSRPPSGPSPTPSHHHHHHHKKEESQSNPSKVDSPTAPSGEDKPQSTVIKGPWRLLRLLPRESRHIIGRMLEIDPKKRATLAEILNDKWVLNSQVCSQEEGGRVVAAENHEHTLEGSAGTSSAPPSKQPQK